MVSTIDSSFVRALRGERNWSQDDLAAAAGLSGRTVQRVETEGRGALETLKALAAAFDVDTDDLRGPDRQSRARSGMRFGMGGAALGYLSAAAAITYALAQGQLSSADAGAALGTLGAMTGVVCAAIGWLGHRMKAH